VLFGVVPSLVVIALVVSGVALGLTRAKPSPLWGRLADITDILLMISLIPLALAVFDTYEMIRGLVS
jgi:hypothetical protein